VEINFSADQTVINRETYSMLDWLGDMGGLLDAIFILCEILVYPVAAFKLRATLLADLFRYRKSDRKLVDWPKASTFLDKNMASSEETQNLLKSMNNDFQVMSSIKQLHFYAVNLLCLKKYKRMLMKS
jgi:hypothetical protein